MTAETSALREAIEARVALLSGWTLVDIPPQQLAVTDVPDAVPDSVAHLAFTVDMPRSVFESERQQGAGAIAMLAKTDLVIRFLARTRPRDKLDSFSAALDAERDLVRQVLVWSAVRAQAAITWRSTARSKSPSNPWYLVELTFEALHPVTLS